jgi:hypothetical protein
MSFRVGDFTEPRRLSEMAEAIAPVLPCGTKTPGQTAALAIWKDRRTPRFRAAVAAATPLPWKTVRLPGYFLFKTYRGEDVYERMITYQTSGGT